MPALLPLFIQSLPYLFKLGQEVPVVMDYIHRVREDFKQKGEWTQSEEDLFTNELNQLKTAPPPWWTPGT